MRDVQAPAFPTRSLAVKVTSVEPSGSTGGALLTIVGCTSQVSTALTPAKKALNCGSLAETPVGPVHSTTTGAGHDTTGGVVSTTVTRATHEDAFSDASVAVNVIG